MLRYPILILLLLLNSNLLFSYTQRSNLAKAAEKLYIDPHTTEKKCIDIINFLDKSDIKNHTLLMETYILLGKSYDLQGDFDLGIYALTEALDYCDMNDTKNKALINHELATLYNCLYDVNRANELVVDVIKYYEEVKDTVGIALCYNILGLIYVNKKDDVKADSIFNLALALHQKLNLEINKAVIYNNMALYNEDPPRKIEMLKHAIAINKRYNRRWSLAENYNNLGLQYFYDKQYDKALKKLDIAYDIAIATNAKELISDNHRYKSWLYNELKIYDKAYYNSTESDRITKQIQSEENIRNIERIIAQNALNKKKYKIRLMNEIHKSTIIFNTLIFSFIGVFILIIVMFILYKKGKVKRQNELYKAKLELEKNNIELLNIKLEQEEIEKNEMETLLDASTKELTNFSYYIKNRNELFSNIKNHIKSVYHYEKEQMVRELRKIIVLINQYEKTDREQSMMIKQMDQVSDEFLYRLEQLHPGISKTEKRMAIYIHLGMSTKDICMITGSNLKTVNMARYRLRKHLGLASDISIAQYLDSIFK